MFIAGLGTAAPPQRYTQRECWDALNKFARARRLKPRSRAILKKILCGENGIASRYLALEPLTQFFEATPDALQARFTEHAPALAVAAAKRALRDAACARNKIDAILISTCTGYLCPGLTSYVSERLGLRKDVFTLDLVGQGCGAALPNLRAAEAILKAGRAENILSVCVEVCSAAFFLDDDPGVLVSACLFGDGAGAAVVTHKPNKRQRSVEWKFSASHLVPDKRDTLRFGHKNGMLRNMLSPQVPQIAGVAAAKLCSETIAAAGVPREKISGWIMHTGGRDVLLSLRKQLKLSEADLRHSTAILREFGNVSSPTVFFVLERALHDTVPDGYWWMSSFGAGFSCHGALLEVKQRRNLP
ncbi:MAG TPA: 3-oxoacyl-[acyl-carrier-protein] synthase III C-terminal domain-containing protein [Verrucomicrobiae bacterium]|jgi:alkylresorcinol/alkylpyrone synthase